MCSRERVCCSFCGSANVAKMSLFGTAQLVSQYYCKQCKSVFEWVRWRSESNIAGTRDEGKAI